MAKRINKTVLIIGIVVVGIIGLLGSAIAVNELWRKNPNRYIKRAQPKIEAGEFEEAARDYGGAFARSKNKDKQIEYLYKAAELYEKAGKWDKVIGCWGQITLVDAENWQARKNLINYFKERAESGEMGIWQMIEKNVSDYIENREEADLDIEPEMYLLMGQSKLISAQLGITADSAGTNREAKANLEKAIELSEGNAEPEVYKLLALSVLYKGSVDQDRGILNAMDKAKTDAIEILEKGVTANQDDVQAKLNLLDISIQGKGLSDVKAEEPNYLQLIEDYPDEAEVYARVGNYYNMSAKKVDAYEMLSKAIELDEKNINYVLSAARLAYSCYTQTGDKKYYHDTIDLVGRGFEMPGTAVEDVKTKVANINRKYIFHNTLAELYINEALKSEGHEKDILTSKAEENIHEIKQILSSPDSAETRKWDGILNYAKGNYSEGVRLMYDAYESIEAEGKGKANSFLSYILADAFKDTSETGVVFQFLSSAFQDREFLYSHPNEFQEYIAMLVQAGPSIAIQVANNYEMVFGESPEIKILKARAYLATNNRDKAESIIESLDSDDPNRSALQVNLISSQIREKQSTYIQLKASSYPADESAQAALDSIKSEVEKLQEEQSDRTYELLNANSEFIGSTQFSNLYQYFVNANKLDKAKSVVEAYLEKQPDDINAKLYSKLLLEDEPNDVSDERRDELFIETLNEIENPERKAISLGSYYYSKGNLEEATNYFKEAFDINPENTVAFENLFNIYLIDNNQEEIEQLIEHAKEKNLDACEGLYYAARGAMTKNEHSKALELLNKCIEERPVFSSAYMMRGRAHLALNDFDNAVEDAYKARRLSPYNTEFVKNLATILYTRNQRLGIDVTQDQIIEAKKVLQEAIAANPSNQELQLLYAEYLAQESPESVLAMLQAIQKRSPNIETALNISRIAMRLATQSRPAVARDVQEAMLQIAESSLKQVLEMEPKNTTALSIYTQLLQMTERTDEAEEFAKRDETLLWNYYLASGRTEEALEILKKIYEENPDDKQALSTLLLISEKTKDANDVKKYSEELVAMSPDDIEVLLAQIRGLIETNQIEEASKKLVSFKVKYPDNARADLLQAFVDIRNSEFDKAMGSVKKALVNEPDNGRAWYLKGEINSLLTKFDEAIEDYKKSKAIESKIDVRVALAKAYLNNDMVSDAITELKILANNPQTPIQIWLLLEDIYLRKGSKADVEDFYEDALEKFNNGSYWILKKANYAVSKKEFELAEKLYLAVWEASLPQGNADAFGGYINVLLLSERYDDMYKFASKYVDSNQSIMALLAMAEAKYKLGEEAEAMELYGMTLDKAEDNYSLANTVCSAIYRVAGEKASKDFIEGKLKDSSAAKIYHYVLHNWYLAKEQYQKALDNLEETISLEEDETGKTQIRQGKMAILQQAYARTANERYYDTLMAEYENYLAKNPEDLSMLNNISYMLASKGEQLDRALEYAEQAYKKIPNNPGIIDTYGFVLLKQGKTEQALKMFLKSKQLFEAQKPFAPAEVYDHIANAYEKLENKDSALIYYEQALELSQKSMSEDDIERIKSSISKLTDEL